MKCKKERRNLSAPCKHAVVDGVLYERPMEQSKDSSSSFFSSSPSSSTSSGDVSLQYRAYNLNQYFRHVSFSFPMTSWLWSFLFPIFCLSVYLSVCLSVFLLLLLFFFRVLAILGHDLTSLGFNHSSPSLFQMQTQTMKKYRCMIHRERSSDLQ